MCMYISMCISDENLLLFGGEHILGMVSRTVKRGNTIKLTYLSFQSKQHLLTFSSNITS